MMIMFFAVMISMAKLQSKFQKNHTNNHYIFEKHFLHSFDQYPTLAPHTGHSVRPNDCMIDEVLKNIFMILCSKLIKF